MAYYIKIMKRWVDSGRVKWLPRTKFDYTGTSNDYKTYTLRPELTPHKTYSVQIKRKLVDATYTGTEVPSCVPPRFKVSPDVDFVPPNSLVKIDKEYERYCVLGAGKTAIDTVIYLLDYGIPGD